MKLDRRTLLRSVGGTLATAGVREFRLDLRRRRERQRRDRNPRLRVVGRVYDHANRHRRRRREPTPCPLRSGYFGHCGTAYSYEHANAGRAYRETWAGAYYAVESDDYLGFPADTSTLEGTSEGHYEAISSC